MLVKEGLKAYNSLYRRGDTMHEKLNFIMIAPHFPENFDTFALRLNEAGFNTLGIADIPYDSLSDVLKNNLTEYYKVDDLENYEDVLKAVGYFVSKYGRIHRIESHNEHWLELDAKLRTDFNVFGYKNEDIEHIKNKSGMKKVFKSLGLKVADGRVFKDEKDAFKLARRLKYPVIIKPDSGVGASDTFKINSKTDLEDFFKTYNPNISYIMEAFIEGDIVTFDGLTNQKGDIVFSSSLIYKENVLDTVKYDSDIFFYIPRRIDRELRALGTQITKAFNTKERFFHFEFFKTKEGELIPLEVNMRPPGGATIDMFNYANNLDIFKEYANLAKGLPFGSKMERPYYCAYVSRKYQNYTYAHTQDDIKAYLGHDFISVQTIPGVFSQIMGDEGYIFKCKTKRELETYINYISKKEKKA